MWLWPGATHCKGDDERGKTCGEEERQSNETHLTGKQEAEF